MKKRQYRWKVVYAYDCGAVKRGSVVSRHETHAAASKAMKRAAFSSFLKIVET